MSKVCHVNGPQIYIRKQIEMMEKLKGQIAFGLSVRPCVRPSIRASVTKFIKIQFWNFIYGFLIKK